jgi:hypothetical protein
MVQHAGVIGLGTIGQASLIADSGFATGYDNPAL